MNHRRWMVWGLVVLLFPAIGLAKGHGHEKAVKKGILLAAFGSSMPEAQVSFDNIDKKTRKMFPGIPVRWAYTSSMIRKKMAKSGKNLDSVALALSKMMEEGFTHVAVQSLHTIRGSEFDDLVQTVHAFRNMPNGLDRIVIGDPLLSSQKDLERVASAIMENIPPTRKPDEAVVLMGHGTHHPANAFYTALTYHLQQKDPAVFVGTVDGAPEISEIKEMLLEKKVRKACLMPFMSVAGDHARNDMAGEGEDSWKKILTGAGITCTVILKGTAEYDNMIQVWMDHLNVAVNKLE